jgi:holdfast attachment protein HfaA
MHFRLMPLSAALVSSVIAIAPALAAPVTIQQQQAQAAEGMANSAQYNSGFGMAPGQENRPISGSNRDANGNLVIVNGIMSGAGTVSQQDAARQSGVAGGTGGASATAIGNNLNVTVTGAWNTVIVDSKQTNNGDQNASASLNGKLNF